MMRAPIILILSATALPASAQSVADDSLMVTYRSKTQVIRPCDRSGDAIVVCGTQKERNARERLSLPRESVDSAPPRGDVPRASSAPVKQGSCGVVGGQGGGCVGGLNARKILSDAAKGIVAIIDPGADLAPPPPLPDRYKGAGQH
ncbi:hypothetical protein [Sphingobium sp.]|uniref:hypothetical protein n=1 Tax=Sphingobium sp. TaxID=1912891 RepID=UPI003BB6D750